MKTGRVYTTGIPGKVSGRIAICDQSRRVNLIPAERWLPPQEVTRTAAAQLMRQVRREAKLTARPAFDHELIGMDSP